MNELNVFSGIDVLKMEENALASQLVKRVRAYFQNEEHQKEFEEWHLKKYGKPFEKRCCHEDRRELKVTISKDDKGAT